MWKVGPVTELNGRSGNDVTPLMIGLDHVEWDPCAVDDIAERIRGMRPCWLRVANFFDRTLKVLRLLDRPQQVMWKLEFWGTDTPYDRVPASPGVAEETGVVAMLFDVGVGVATQQPTVAPGTPLMRLDGDEVGGRDHNELATVDQQFDRPSAPDCARVGTSPPRRPAGPGSRRVRSGRKPRWSSWCPEVVRDIWRASATRGRRRLGGSAERAGRPARPAG
jgi:hypothetical protein